MGRSCERRDALAERVQDDGGVLAAGRHPQRCSGGGAEADDREQALGVRLTPVHGHRDVGGEADRAWVRELVLGEGQELATRALGCTTAQQVEALVAPVAERLAAVERGDLVAAKAQIRRMS